MTWHCIARSRQRETANRRPVERRGSLPLLAECRSRAPTASSAPTATAEASTRAEFAGLRSGCREHMCHQDAQATGCSSRVTGSWSTGTKWTQAAKTQDIGRNLPLWPLQRVQLSSWPVRPGVRRSGRMLTAILGQVLAGGGPVDDPVVIDLR
jgi:hypothetical protein